MTIIGAARAKHSGSVAKQHFALAALVATLVVPSWAGAAEPTRAKAGPARKSQIKTRSSAVMGVRGLDEMDLKSAAPDEKALAALDRYRPTPAEVDRFASDSGKTLVAIVGGSPEKIADTDLADEAKFGREIAATLLGAAPLVDEPSLQRYVNLVGTWISLRSDRPDLPWRFGVMASDSVNAFAVPGGYVFITLGLYQKLKSEGELAGVIGHEISHVVSRDHYNMLVIARNMDRAGEAAKKMMAKMPGFRGLANFTIDRSSSVFGCALDRNAEISADRMGMVLAADAGYAPQGLPKVLEVLSLVPRDDAQAALLFKTHPAPADRLAAVQEVSRSLANKESHPDMKARFDEYDLSALKVVRRNAR